MTKPVLSLLLLWSLWSTTGLGFSDFASNEGTLDNREQRDGGNEPVAVRWVVTGRNDNEAQAPSITAAPVLPKAALPDNSRLQNRQTTADPDDTSDDNGPLPPPTPPPGLPGLAQASSSISSSVSAAVSSSVAGFFSSSLLALSIASSSAVASARIAGISEGISSVTAGASAPTTTAASVTSPQTTGVTSSTSEVSTTGADTSSAIADIQTSASKAVEEAQASASSSAQSAVDAANASASAVMAGTGIPQTQRSSLTPGQIGGIVISIAFISSLLSALATFLLMRRKARLQESTNKLEPDWPLGPGAQAAAPAPAADPRPHSLTQSIRNRLSSFHMFGAPIMPPYRRSQSPSNSNSNSSNFAADVKRRPPSSEHPALAMSHSARPLSDPVFPVSPVSSVGDQSLILQSHEPEPRLQPSPPMPAPVVAADVSTTARASGAPGRVSLAREQSISGGQRPQLVRVGSGRERKGASDDPLSMNPVCADSGYDAVPVSATGQCHMVLPMQSPREEDLHGGWRTSAGTEISAVSSFQVQAPIPRRLVDPISLEQGPNYLPHAFDGHY
ncbi:hypothetical protein F4781DRAFT_380421 [Annulohypoxylon bovei var. microspora]|nr:hypothetical protein F4781DRAFT_380421 [Annulohypoxylon bovei var. microspora]